MRFDPPTVLPYADASRSPPSFGAFIVGSIALALLFAISFGVIESKTSAYLRYDKQIFGPAPPGSYAAYRQAKEEFTSLLTEYLWAVPATAVVLVGLLAVAPRRGLRLRWPPFAVCLLGSLAYSWVRWAPGVLELKPLSERGDFALAMLLAAATGLATGWVRRVCG